MPPTIEEEEEYQGDTIVVKGEYPPWSRPSSPESMTPEIDVANLLAQIQSAPAHHIESSSTLEEVQNAGQSSAPLQPRATPRTRQKLNVSTTEDRLMAMPERRPLPWRDGVEPGAENETGGESRRKQIRFGCLLATRGEIQENPCASCANGRGKFRVCVALEGYFKGACASCQLSGRPNRCSIKVQDEDEIGPTVNTPSQSFTNPPPTQSKAAPSAPNSKRRKTDMPPQPAPEWERTRPQWEQELGDSQHMNSGRSAWATVNSQLPPSGINTIRTIPQEQRGWAAVNALPPPRSYNSTPNTNGYQQNVEQGVREATVMDGDGVALIDTLPKSKQRQVYGLVSGLQNGIQGLQRELDALKKALGIDEN